MQPIFVCKLSKITAKSIYWTEVLWYAAKKINFNSGRTVQSIFQNTCKKKKNNIQTNALPQKRASHSYVYYSSRKKTLQKKFCKKKRRIISYKNKRI